jgi:hypothetical protein
VEVVIVGKNEFIRHIIGMEYLYGTRDVLDHTSQHVQAAFAEISRINRELFDLIPYEVVFTTEDVYQSAKEMRERVVSENKIYIYSGWGGHPILTQEQNNIGRAVHDVFAHMVCGCPFNFEGEFTAYLEQRNYYPRWTWDVLFSEIPCQTAAYYVNGNSHDFDQRAIAARPQWMTLGDLLTLPDYSHNTVLSPATFMKIKSVEVVS